jgi:hypothetical protein
VGGAYRSPNQKSTDFTYSTFLKLRGPIPKNVGNWIKLPAPIRGPHRRFCLPVDLRSDRTALAFLDLRSSNFLMMSAEFPKRLRLFYGRRISTAATWMVSGIAVSTTSLLARFKIGDFAPSNVPVESFEEWSVPSLP